MRHMKRQRILIREYLNFLRISVVIIPKSSILCELGILGVSENAGKYPHKRRFDMNWGY